MSKFKTGTNVWARRRSGGEISGRIVDATQTERGAWFTVRALGRNGPLIGKFRAAHLTRR